MSSDLVQVKWETRRKVLFKDLNSLRNKQIHTDITLLCDGKSYPVHRLILSMTSGYFARVLQTKQEQLSPSLVLICGIKAPVLQALLNFIYDGMTTIKGEDIPNLLQAGIMFEIPGLMEMGSDFVAPKSNINSEVGCDKTSVKLTSASTTLCKTGSNGEKAKHHSSGLEMHSSCSTIQEESCQRGLAHESVNQDDTGNYRDKDDCCEDKKKYSGSAASTAAQLLRTDQSNSEEELFEGWEVPQVSKKKKTTKGYKRSHRCPVCGRGFFKKDSLTVHVKNHKSFAPFICKYCEECFKNERNYKSHSQKCFSMAGRRKLGSSSKRNVQESSLQNMKRSKMESDSENVTIDSVLKSVSQSFKISFSDSHQQRHKQYFMTDDSIYDEEIKPTHFATDMQRPLLPASHENGTTSSSNPIRDCVDLEHSVASVRTKECKYCHISFSDNRKYKKHRTTDCIVLECPYCLINFKREEKIEYREHVNTHRHSQNPYTCPTCSFFTNRMKLFEDHISMHTGVFRLWCSLCDFQTPTSHDLNAHFTQTHPGVDLN